MNHEKINAERERYLADVTNDLNRKLLGFGFDHGIQYAADNPDVIDCVSVEDVKKLYQTVTAMINNGGTEDDLPAVLVHIDKLIKQQP